MTINKTIKVVCEFLKIHVPIIKYNAFDSCFYSNGIIHLNLKIEKEKLLYLAIHELRHYYQEIYIKNNNDKLSKIWKFEMNNYIFSYHIYLNYEKEKDAYSFAYLALLHIFNIHYKLHPSIKEIVLKYINLHKDDLYSDIINYKH